MVPTPIFPNPPVFEKENRGRVGAAVHEKMALLILCDPELKKYFKDYKPKSNYTINDFIHYSTDSCNQLRDFTKSLKSYSDVFAIGKKSGKGKGHLVSLSLNLNREATSWKLVRRVETAEGFQDGQVIWTEGKHQIVRSSLQANQTILLPFFQGLAPNVINYLFDPSDPLWVPQKGSSDRERWEKDMLVYLGIEYNGVRFVHLVRDWIKTLFKKIRKEKKKDENYRLTDEDQGWLDLKKKGESWKAGDEKVVSSTERKISSRKTHRLLLRTEGFGGKPLSSLKKSLNV